MTVKSVKEFCNEPFYFWDILQKDIDFLIDGIGYEVKTQNCILENKICIELKSNVEKNYNGWFYTTAA